MMRVAPDLALRGRARRSVAPSGTSMQLESLEARAGAPTWSYRPPGTTAVYIYSGADFSVHATASSYGSQIGEFLTLAGDVDGDGANDFLAGQLILSLDVARAGATSLFTGVAAVADLDGDGQRDFAASIAQQDRIVFFSSAGRAFLRDISVPGFPGGLKASAIARATASTSWPSPFRDAWRCTPRRMARSFRRSTPARYT